MYSHPDARIHDPVIGQAMCLSALEDCSGGMKF
jgi:hypothetical protein